MVAGVGGDVEFIRTKHGRNFGKTSTVRALVKHASTSNKHLKYCKK